MPARDEGHRNKFDHEWLGGSFAGVIARTGEYLAIKGEMFYKCPAIRSRADGEQFTGELFTELRANSYAPQPFWLKPFQQADGR